MKTKNGAENEERPRGIGKGRKVGKEGTHASPHTTWTAESSQVATYSTVIKKSGQVINAYYVASLTVICLKQYNVGYEERAAHFGPRDLIKLTWSEIIAPLPRDTQLSLPVTQSEMRRITEDRRTDDRDDRKSPPRS